MLASFWVDVGGTFTDCLMRREVAEGVGMPLERCKVLSSGEVPGSIGVKEPSSRAFRDPFRGGEPVGLWNGYEIRWYAADGKPCGHARVESSRDGELTVDDNIPAEAFSYTLRSGEEAPLLAIRKLLQLKLGEPLPRVRVRLGTTRGTNALLTRRGARCGLLTNQGFGDLLRIGNQDRPRLFDLNIVKPEPLYEATAEVRGRISANGEPLEPLDEPQLRRELQRLRDLGIESLAICLLHATRNPAHELRAAEAARDAGFDNICLSHQVAPAPRIVPRAETTVLDAYLDPVLRSYLAGLQRALGDSELLLMTSSGGLVSPEYFTGKDSILSGPAGGVVGCAAVATATGHSQAIGFDMGGTSTDVCRYGGEFDRQYESIKAGVRVVTPSLAIETVAAGGGSICGFDGVRLTVGPASAGAEPGPACYGRGGPLTVTDLNVYLGRIPDPALTRRHFPQLSFPIPLCAEPIERRLDELIGRIREATRAEYSRDQLCEAFLQIANESMAQAAKSISIDRGFAPEEHVLVAFGGAAPQHACDVAESLGMSRILIHPAAGLLSAFGIGQAPLVCHQSRAVRLPVAEAKALHNDWRALEQEAIDTLLRQGASADQIEIVWRADICYRDLDAAMTLPAPPESAAELGTVYEEAHERLYGFRQRRPVDVIEIRVEARTKQPDPAPLEPPLGSGAKATPMTSLRQRGRPLATGLYRRAEIAAGVVTPGPAIILDDGTTTVVTPGWEATKLAGGELLLTRSCERRQTGAMPQANSLEEAEFDPARLELFNNQFSSIAEQMGITLRRTASSVNVKERLDFSCAIFTPDGDLVVNAPHIPVHLGAMSETVRCVIEDTPDLAPGDVVVTNDPFRGGSHLPDITVVLPVFERPGSSDSESAEPRLLFFTASRAHHAELGGLTPGSVPPFSRRLSEEGVLIRNFKLIDRGASRFDELRELLTAGPLPSRKPDENLADLTAQLAACRQGADELLRLCERRGRELVLTYMRHMQTAAERKVRAALRRMGNFTRQREDQLDNGAKIVARVAVSAGDADIDFSGTAPVQPNNLNANRAIVSAAVMYCLRCLLDEDIPLNEGVLAPVRIKLPECLLNPPAFPDPADCAAVVGGNVETSQRVVDVLLGAFEAAAASQGTMNNLTFGDDTFGYYETICGGAGATPDAAGADAVHTHMTNTRLTDPEVLETRHPVRLLEFSIRRGSHGRGRHRGGDGIIRRLQFLAPLTVSLLTQRRLTSPFGLAGGENAAPGVNRLDRAHPPAGEPAETQLPGCCQFSVQPNDTLIIETPGGGGWGPVT
ncbi:MAG: hydantoinase B/oxoprolinase family protein [Planctomycetales bacterium]|nr:hydantoinase B/oxoprolinase family protein [Planctomycetales bacterium]